MPLIHVEIMEGRSEAQVENLIKHLTQATEDALQAPRENIRVIVTEIPKTHWGIGGETARNLGR